MLTLVRRPAPIDARAPRGVELRPPCPSDTVPLGRLYFDAYEPGIAAATEPEAIEDIELTFEGAYGVLDLNLSRLAWTDAHLVGAVLVVERAPWPDTPDCAFIIELFTARAFRRRGLASLLLSGCADVTVALRVNENNIPALTLYRNLGFRDG